MVTVSTHEDLGAAKVFYESESDATAAAEGMKHFDFIGHTLHAATANSTAVKYRK